MTFVRTFSVVISAFTVATALTAFSQPVRSEMHLNKITLEEAQHFSSAMKTYICSDEFAAPTWCTEWRASKFSTSISDRIKAREAAKKLAEQKRQEQVALEAARIAAAAEAKKKAKEAALALSKAAGITTAGTEDLFSSPFGQPATTATLSQENSPEAKSKDNSKAWTEFRQTIDLSLLTPDQIEVVEEFAAGESTPEANEVLGYVYSQGIKGIDKDLVEAYRQYGLAFLKGLQRVKGNMDVIWSNLPSNQKTALLSEFDS